MATVTIELEEDGGTTAIWELTEEEAEQLAAYIQIRHGSPNTQWV